MGYKTKTTSFKYKTEAQHYASYARSEGFIAQVVKSKTDRAHPYKVYLYPNKRL